MKNWKTTVLGCIIAAVIAVAPILETGSLEIKDILVAVVVAVFGYFVKDKDVTGVE